MADLAAGSTVAGCRLEAVAGRGGMGVVWRATQLALSRRVAVKAIAPQFAQDEGFRERFQHESRLAASLEHPNVIPVYDSGELDDLLYLIMRWVDGTDLRQLLTKCGRLGPADATRVLIPVALALGAAHRRGLIHRDVKPANVLIAGHGGDDEHVYLTDFGLARQAGGDMTMTRTGVLVGTLDYVAPERIEGEKGDAASDIYAFGCMLYETLTGRVPYDRPTELAKMHAHLNDPVPSAREVAPDVPESMDAVIARSMAKRPDSRFASAEELAAALTRAREEIVPDAPATRPEQPAAAVAAAAETLADSAPARVTDAATRLDGETLAVPHRRRPRRISLLVVPAVLLAAVGVAVAVATSGSGGGHPAAGTTPASNVSHGNPANAAPTTTGGLTIASRIPLPGTPTAITAEPSSNRVWVTGPGYVFAEPGAAKTQFSGTPSAIAAGVGQMWITDPTGLLYRYMIHGTKLVPAGSRSSIARLVTLDPRDGSAWVADATGRVAHVGPNLQFTQLRQVTPPPTDMTSGEGWLWAVNGKQLIRIDPRGVVSNAAWPDGSAPLAVTLNRGVWTGQADGKVVRFDPRATFSQPNGTTGHGLRVNMEVKVTSGAPLGMIAAVEAGPEVWTASAQTRTLYRIDYDTHRVTGTVTFPRAPIGLAVTAGSVWVITGDATLFRVGG